jgi:hypothetical protein
VGIGVGEKSLMYISSPLMNQSYYIYIYIYIWMKDV